MANVSNDLPAIQVFISYAREDDAAFSFADPLKTTLKQLISGMSGRTAEVFLDRDDIPLGENWKEKIENGVRNSLVFVAVYTGNYLRREPCRDEFFLFLEQSRQLEVQTLLIPVVWLGFDSLLPEGEDEISDYVRTHQAADFKEAWVEGTASAPFKRNVLKIAERVLQVTSQVEDTLAAKERDVVERSIQRASPQEVTEAQSGASNLSVRQDPDDEVEDEDDDGLFELSEMMNSDLQVMTREAELLGTAMQGLGTLPDPPKDASSSPAAATKYMILAANAMRDPAKEIEQHGSKLFQATRRCDATLRRIVRVADASGSEEIRNNLYTSLAPNIKTLSELSAVDDQLNSLLEKMRGPEALSASVRKAARPARRGVTSVRDALSLISDWPTLVDSLNESPSPSKA
ncbi:toll/interleukin-1 receptor domain-containing protein [Leucobacter sp. wl10]|uniref:toll/interleukin-1 receptor domain-containing protein n=1 Tax=Leucobacter sp. wl10 TaxID=2304677 RepID=UPI000E5BBFFA|nr:toll/interleukin-1 receptor domain-containing protein [Leucobacter sp. wl10]RGE18868.1 toll/interleukin-1 receptor domain-containing protein [Leucobacter sp. wl10]